MLNDIQILLCEKDSRKVIENLTQFYFYDILQNSQYSHYKLTENGIYEKMPYFENYWEEDNRYPFVIKQENLPIGFALVHNITLNKNADWKMAEFFILAPYRKKGIARYVVKNILNLLPGLWEFSVFKDNEIAKKFWQNILSDAQERTYQEYPEFIIYEAEVF